MSESPIPDETGPDLDGAAEGAGDPFDPAEDVFDLDSGFDAVHAQKPTEGSANADSGAPGFVFTVTPPRGGALAEQIDRFMALFLGYQHDRDAPLRIGEACYALGCPGGAVEAEALRSALARTLFESDDPALVSVRPAKASPAGGVAAPDHEQEPAETAPAPAGDTAVADEAADETEEDWLTAAAAEAAHADGDTFDLDLLGPPPETEPEAVSAPDPAGGKGADHDAEPGFEPGAGHDVPADEGEPDGADSFRADMRAIAEAARGEDDAAAPVEEFQAALEGLIGDLDARLGAAADRLEASAAHVDERAREALSALLSAGESLRGYAQRTAGGGDDGRLDRMEAGLHAALDRLAEAQTAQDARIADRVIAALGGGSDADRAA